MKILFLDLEDTVITPVTNGWWDFEVINKTTISQVIEDFKPDKIELFSFAVHDQKQKSLFEKHTKKYIQDILKIELSLVPTVDEDIIPACCKQKGLAPSCVSFMEAGDFWGKDLAWWLYLQQNYSHHSSLQALLLDDALKTQKFETSNITAHCINIDELRLNYEKVFPNSLTTYTTPLSTGVKQLKM